MDTNDFLGSFAQENVSFTTRVVKTSAVGDNYKLNLLFYDEEVDEYFELKYTGAIEVNYEDYVTTATKSMQQRPARGRRPATKLLRSTKIRPGSGARRMVL